MAKSSWKEIQLMFIQITVPHLNSNYQHVTNIGWGRFNSGGKGFNRVIWLSRTNLILGRVNAGKVSNKGGDSGFSPCPCQRLWLRALLKHARPLLKASVLAGPYSWDAALMAGFFLSFRSQIEVNPHLTCHGQQNILHFLYSTCYLKWLLLWIIVCVPLPQNAFGSLFHCNSQLLAQGLICNMCVQVCVVHGKYSIIF